MKKIHRFLGPYQLGQGICRIDDADLAHQMRSVLKLEPGETVIVGDGTGQLEGRVTKSVFLGAVQHCEVLLRDGTAIRLGTAPDRPLPADGTVSVRLDVDRAWLMPDTAP